MGKIQHLPIFATICTTGAFKKTQGGRYVCVSHISRRLSIRLAAARASAVRRWHYLPSRWYNVFGNELWIALVRKPIYEYPEGKPAAKETAATPQQASPTSFPTKPQARINRPSPTSPLPDRLPNMPCGTPLAPPLAPEPAPPPACVEQPAQASQPPERRTAEQQASILWNCIVPSLMTRALGVEESIQPMGCRFLLDRLVDNAGGSEDSIEVMLMEQLAMAHYRVAQLQAQAAEAKSLSAVRVLNTAATRLLARVWQDCSDASDVP